ncbi:hypothetical protein ABZT17_30905 [Streptomyces sp. NPDC005648]|uniref:hypothetical protein n=1 Tax=Streptomyces sp. NPDC005648 TaxID=3157044 RepID=UPI0033BB6A25
MRVAHTLVGGLAGVVWLVLPGMTVGHDVPAAQTRARTAAVEDETSGADLVLPLAVVGAAGALAGYGYVRRTRRARTRTTPGGGSAAAGAAVPPPLTGPDERARALLVEADDWVRTSREELGFAEAGAGTEAVAPFARALRDAEAELAAAFRIRRRYDDGVPEDEASRLHVLAGIVGRCQEAGRRLDAEADGFDRLRALEGPGTGRALALAETRFRELAARAGGAAATVDGLSERYGSSAVAPVTGHVEQAKDRLVQATTRLNQARQSADMGEAAAAVHHLRAAETATAQAAELVDGVDRLAVDLASAAALVPAALTGAEAVLARTPDTAHADPVLAAVREELTAGPYDPLGALRRVVRAVGAVDGVLSAAGLLVARDSVSGTDGFISVHRTAVRSAARIQLAEARRLLTTDPVTADALARRAREVAEQDVRTHGHRTEDPPTAFGGPRTRQRTASLRTD